MASRKYRGIEIDPAHIDMAKNLDSVHELIDELRDLQSTWNNLSLLGELTNVGAEISDTRQHFQKLAGDLTNFLVEQSTNQAVEMLSTRAQNAIDILVRNLYERTADIGFLATDPVFTQRCMDAQTGPLNDAALASTRQRMKDYVEKYSVYKNIVLMDTQARVIVDMKGQLSPGISLEWIREWVAKGSQYAEAFRPLQTDHNGARDELIYAWKIMVAGQVKGYIALLFNLDQESEALFAKVVGQRRAQALPEWKVCGVSKSTGEVLVSSNPEYIGPGQTIRLPEGARWSLVQVGPVAYLGCMRTTRGYQGYSGPGWKGFCLVPLTHAFNAGFSDPVQNIELDYTTGLIDKRILGFQAQASQIQKQLNRSIWNGNMTQRQSTSTLGNSFSKTLLWEISRAGENTKTLFTNSLNNLVQAEINGFQTEQQTRAMLAMDLMDRNLYERANDCRWWAQNPTLNHALLNTDDDLIMEQARQCLQHIHGLYTVYTNILLIDRTGRVVCDSASIVESGTLVESSWVSEAMQLKSPARYCVSPFEKTTLYQDRPTYIYAAALFDNGHKPAHAIGAIALVFDSEPQFEAILNESMGDSKHQALGFIVDENHRVISSTTNLYIDQGKLTLPLKRHNKFEKQKAEQGYFHIDGRLVAYGTCNSGAYREYKSDLDAYQNNLICVYGLDVGALADDLEASTSDISFDELRQGGQKEQVVDIASFRVAQHWYGIDSEDAVEAFLCNQVVSLPNSPSWLLGTTLYKNEAVTVVDIAEILDPRRLKKGATPARPQMILLKNRYDSVKIALAVDELGEIPSLPMSAIHESESLNGQSGIVQGLIKTVDNLLVVLNIEQLLKQLETGIKKTPCVNKGLSSAALNRERVQ
jgi:chemotaxis signal transduction protein